MHNYSTLYSYRNSSMLCQNRPDSDGPHEDANLFSHKVSKGKPHHKSRWWSLDTCSTQSSNRHTWRVFGAHSLPDRLWDLVLMLQLTRIAMHIDVYSRPIVPDHRLQLV